MDVVKKDDQTQDLLPGLVEQQKEKNFYSKEELEEFKNIILLKLSEAELQKSDLEREMKDFGAETSGDNADAASLSQQKQDKELLLTRQKVFITNLKNALVRIENGTYGICKSSGKLIPAERLRLAPHATEIVQVKIARNKSK